MKVFYKPRKLSDDEYIERARRSVVRTEKYRYWWYLYLIFLVFGTAWVGHKLFQAAIGLMGNAPAVWAGFATGAMMGLVFCSVVYGMFHSAVYAMMGFRSERLLVKYYDAFREVVDGVPTGTDSPDSDCTRDEQDS